MPKFVFNSSRVRAPGSKQKRSLESPKGVLSDLHRDFFPVLADVVAGSLAGGRRHVEKDG